MTLKKRVHQALDNANASGYNPSEADSMTTAMELVDYTDEFERNTTIQLIPHIKAWKALHDESRAGMEKETLNWKKGTHQHDAKSQGRKEV